MKKIKVKSFIPFETVDSHGDVFAKDCKFTIAPGVKILESHRMDSGITLITKMEIDEVPIVPKTFGFNVF